MTHSGKDGISLKLALITCGGLNIHGSEKVTQVILLIWSKGTHFLRLSISLFFFPVRRCGNFTLPHQANVTGGRHLGAG